MNRRKIGVLFLWILGINPLSAFASDPTDLTEIISLLSDQLELLSEQFEELKDQNLELDAHTITLNDQYLSMGHGKTSVDDLFNISTNDDFWDWTPTIEEIEDMRSSGLQEGKLKDRLAYYEGRYGEAKDPEDFNEDYSENQPHTQIAALQSDQSANARFGLALGEASFNRTEEFQNGYQKQFDKLENIETQKQSADFNNQLQLQLTQMVNELIKLQAAQVKMQSLILKEYDHENEFNDRFFNVSSSTPSNY